MASRKTKIRLRNAQSDLGFPCPHMAFSFVALHLYGHKKRNTNNVILIVYYQFSVDGISGIRFGHHMTTVDAINVALRKQFKASFRG